MLLRLLLPVRLTKVERKSYRLYLCKGRSRSSQTSAVALKCRYPSQADHLIEGPFLCRVSLRTQDKIIVIIGYTEIFARIIPQWLCPLFAPETLEILELLENISISNYEYLTVCINFFLNI